MNVGETDRFGRERFAALPYGPRSWYGEDRVKDRRCLHWHRTAVAALRCISGPAGKPDDASNHGDPQGPPRRPARLRSPRKSLTPDERRAHRLGLEALARRASDDHDAGPGID
jgi:hypothetical protein